MKKNNFYQLFNTKGLLLIILLAFIIRMIFFIALQPWENEVINKTILVKDAAGYHQLALSLLSKKSFEDFDTFRTPGYPLFVAMIYAISSCKIWLVLFLQIIMNIASLLLLYKIASAIFSRNIALLSAFLFAIDPLQIIYSVQLLTDTLFVFLFLVSTYYLCNGIIRKNYTFLIISALALGLATLVRPISYLFPLVIIIFIFLFSNITVKLKLLYSVVFTVIFIAAISPWLYHNYSKYGEVNLSSISGYNLLFYNVASTESYKTGMPIEEVRNKFDKLALQRGYDTTELNPYKNSRIFSNIAGEYIRDNFILYCKRQLMGVVYLYCASPSGVIASNFHQESRYDGTGKYSANFRYLNMFMSMSLAEIVITISIFLFLLINYLYSLYGIYLSAKLKNKYVFLLIFIILYFTILTGAVGGSRYRLPFMPFINILCAAGILYLYSKIKDKFRSVKK